jgi:EmrB/QacA subfamily drug resistance transporter
MSSSSPAAGAATTPAVPDDAVPSPLYRLRWVCLAIVLVAEIMDLLDSTVITIAAPTVRAELGGSAATMQWWAAGYTMAFGVFMIVGGRLGDIYGRKRVFVAGIVGFTLASAACALATSPELLIAFRVLQGGFGALLIPQGLGIIKTVFPPSEMAAAFGAFGPVMGLAAVGGPVLAGWLVSADLLDTGWRMIFLVNLPLGALGLLGALKFFPESRAPEKLRLDPLGVLLICGATLAIIYPLVQGRELDWPLWTFGLMALGVALLGVFMVVERRGHGVPLIEPSLLRNRAFTSGLVVGVAFFAGFAGLLLVLSVFLQSGLGFTPEHAGLTFIPATAASAFAAGASFPLMAKYGRGVLQAGIAIIVVGLVVLAAIIGGGGDLTTWSLVPGLIPFGVGLGFVFGPLFNVILAGVDDREVGSASGTLNAVQQVANAIGVALLGTIFFSLLDHGHPSTEAMRDTALISAGLFAVAFGLSFLLPREARMEDPH